VIGAIINLSDDIGAFSYFFDSGEFITAIHSLGSAHSPAISLLFTPNLLHLFGNIVQGQYCNRLLQQSHATLSICLFPISWQMRNGG
jgi:hypothetical protein